MTDRIMNFLANHREDGPRLVVDLDVVRENYYGFAKALPDTRVFYAVKANPRAGDPRSPRPPRLVLRHRFGRRDRTGDGCRRDARPHQLRQYDQEGARYRARLCARHPSVRGRLRSRGREDRARRARLESVLPHPLRRRRRRMAAVAQIRLRARHGGAGDGACPSPRPYRPWPVVPCRLAAAQPAHVGRRAEGLRPDIQGSRREGHQPRA